MFEVSLWDIINAIATLYTFYCCVERIYKKLSKKNTEDKNANNRSKKRRKRKNKRRS